MENKKANNRIKVLEVLVGASGLYGGVEQFIFENIRRFDKNKIEVDILFGNIKTTISQQTIDIYENFATYELKTYNGRLNGAIKTWKKINDHLKKNRYDIIHVNTGSITFEMICMLAAKRNSIPIRIAHSHSGKMDYSIKKKLFFKFAKKLVWNYSTDRFACSQRAAKALFGKTENVRIIKNAININDYKFNRTKRRELRNREGIKESTLVLITVGNLQKVKNHKFMIDVFYDIHKKELDSKLWIIGEGEERDKREEIIKKMNITDSVTLWGARNDVGLLLQAADIYICTSFSEGLSMSIIEAQAAGLKIFAPNNISKEHSVTDLISYLSLDEKPSSWAKHILSMYNIENERCDMSHKLKEAHYDIDYLSNWLQEFYINKEEKV